MICGVARSFHREDLTCVNTRLSISYLDPLLGDHGNMITNMTLLMLISVFYMVARAC